MSLRVDRKPVYQADFNKFFNPVASVDNFQQGSILESYDLCTGKLEYFNPKYDATYYNNPLVKIIDGYFRINPREEDVFVSSLGTLDLRDVSILDRYVQLEVVAAKANINVADDLLFSHGDSKTYPAIRKAKIFQFGVALPELEYRALGEGRGAGYSLVAAKVESELQASRGRMLTTMCNWFNGYGTTLTNDVQYDPDWIPLGQLKPATGTPSNPEDCCSTAGTITSFATNLTGTNKSNDFILNSVGAAMKLFTAQRETLTGEKLKKNTGNNYLMTHNEDAIIDLKLMHPKSGDAEEVSKSYMDQITGSGIKVIESYEIDAAASVAEDGTRQFQLFLNPKDNFKIGMISNYHIEDWEFAVVDGIKRYTKRAWFKAIAYAVPYLINAKWKKALVIGQYVYKNDA